MKPPRVAVLGCGYWGSNHVRTLKSLGALHAVSDANAARAEGFASEQECLAIAPGELVSRDDVDAIVLALPPQHHTEYAIRAVENGKDVTGYYYSGTDGKKYEVAGKIGSVPHAVQFRVTFPRSVQTFHGMLFTGDGRVITGTSVLQGRETGFYAVRQEE